jgi:hypothetical protein
MTDDLWYATGLEVDPKTGEAIVEDQYLVPIPPKEIYNGAGIATAWYRMSGFWYIIFGAEY